MVAQGMVDDEIPDLIAGRPGLAVAARAEPLEFDLADSPWELTDELDDAASAQLNVAAAMPAAGDEPWPVGRTPFGDEHSISDEEVQSASGFGPVPKYPWAAPLYFLRCVAARRRLKHELAAADVALGERERQRDAQLAELALALRPSLSVQERFADIYAEAEQHQALVLERKLKLAGAARDGHSGLHQLDAQLETARGVFALRQRDTGDQEQLAGQGEREVQRLGAAAQKLSIAERNLMERAREVAGPGAVMPPDLAARYLATKKECDVANEALTARQATQRALQQRLRETTDAERRALATLRQSEAKRESLVLAQEGRLQELAAAVEEARRLQTETLARAGRAVVELRGAVGVETSRRQVLLECDHRVAVAAYHLELLCRAQLSVDRPAFLLGQRLLLGAVAVLLAFLLLSAVGPYTAS